MTVFADSSALVKLYVDEADAEVIRVVPSCVVSAVARVEVPAALWRKVRTGDLAVEQVALLLADFEADWYGEPAGAAPRVQPVAAGLPVLELAARATAGHGLRAYDAVQLASAAVARAAAPEVDVVACFDDRLRAAVAAEGFALLPPAL